MRFDLRHRAIRTAFLGALFGASPAVALAAGPAQVPTGHADTRQRQGSRQAATARTTTPGATPHAAAPSEKAAAPAPRAAGTPAPATGPKVEARRGRGHF